MKKFLKALAIILILILISGVGGYFYLMSWYRDSLEALAPGNSDTLTFIINPGQNAATIGSRLKEMEIIKNDMVFRYYSRVNNYDSRIKAGEYELSPSMTIRELMEKFITGDVVRRTRRFTIPEGYEIKQMARYFELRDIITQDDFFKALENFPKPEYVKENSNIIFPWEGFLFPDTYEINEGASSETIIGLMHGKFQQVFNKELMDRANELGMDIHSVITLASIIEREGVKREELPIISSVFHNRLKKRMLLQSCATVQYIMEERREILLIKDTQIDNPYNTYKYIGLPPGPIAAPGKDAIIAALYPAQTDYLYFVAKKDGSHIFSKTLAEHNRAIRLIRD